MKTKSKAAHKSYEVLLTAYATVVVVDAESEEKALEYAEQEVSRGDFEIEAFTIERELTTPQQIEQAKRHANAVALPDEV